MMTRSTGKGDSRRVDDLAVRGVKKFWFAEQGEHNAERRWCAAGRFRQCGSSQALWLFASDEDV